MLLFVIIIIIDSSTSPGRQVLRAKQSFSPLGMAAANELVVHGRVQCQCHCYDIIIRMQQLLLLVATGTYIAET